MVKTDNSIQLTNAFKGDVFYSVSGTVMLSESASEATRFTREFVAVQRDPSFGGLHSEDLIQDDRTV